MKSKYKVGNLIYDANIYDGMNGFKILHKFGGFDEEAFDDNSEKQIYVCKHLFS